MKSQKDKEADAKKLQKLLVAPDPPDLVGTATVPHGLTFVAIEGVAAINGLPGTGGPIAPSVYRDELIDEMKKNDVPDPHGFLELPETALVRVQGIIGPGARRGDPIDVRIVSPPESDATDLHGGWLMDTRLRQQQRLAGAVRKSDVLAVGMGPVLVRADHESESDPALKLQGLVLGGGRVQQERKLGLVIRPEYQHVKMASQFANAINERFYFFDGSTRTGIAKAVEDDFIEIQIHPRYRRNIHRLMAVVAKVCPKGESSQTQAVLTDLGRRINEPTTADDAAIQLEALGDSAIPTLLSAVSSPNREIRFYAAQALAYLDRKEAVAPLTEAARDEAAFRYPALIALEGMDNRSALDALASLMNEASFETRYGAMRSIRRRADGESVLRSTPLPAGYRLYQIASTAQPFIAISLSEAPEIVCFGDVSDVNIEDFLLGPGGLVIRPGETDKRVLRISRYVPGQDDRKTEVPATVEGLLVGIASVGGGYGEAIAVLRSAKTNQQISCGLALDPLPQAMRTYHRGSASELSDPAAMPPEDVVLDKVEESKSSWWPFQ
ncbi:MAG: flagellar basal body P-ring protein FlgI [Planctomycetaceae bacterium]